MGPTASGKSALALDLAARLGGEIVNADSMQVYRDLRVVTARPSVADEARAPHHLYGHVDAAERYSVGRWLKDALAAIDDIRARGGTPILVGGTGLYFTALTRGLADIPAPDPEIEARLAARGEAEGAPALHAALAHVDPIAAGRIEPNDARRLVRALAVFESSGAPISAWQAKTAPALAPGAWRGIVVDPGADRAALRTRIAARFDAMLTEGALDEVAELMARRLPPDLPALQALGAPQLAAYLRQEISLEAARTAAVIASGQYAKRQETWARNQFGPDWLRIPAPAADLEAVLRHFG